MYVLMINKTIKFASFFVIFLGLFSKRNRKHFPCFYRVIETLVKVWENSKKLWKRSPAARVPTAFSTAFFFFSFRRTPVENSPAAPTTRVSITR